MHEAKMNSIKHKSISIHLLEDNRENVDLDE
jgi:hypothetical protein